MLVRVRITKTQHASTMNCVDDGMKYKHLTKPFFQPTVSLKRVV